MSEPTTAEQVGAEYAEQCFNEERSNPTGDLATVNVERMVGSTAEIPDGDYRWMIDRGINPDSREYWNGYNAKLNELLDA